MYASNILSKVGLIDSKISTTTTTTTLETNVKLLATDGGPLSDPTLYRLLVGNLIYFIVSRSDICYTVQLVS